MRPGVHTATWCRAEGGRRRAGHAGEAWAERVHGSRGIGGPWPALGPAAAPVQHARVPAVLRRQTASSARPLCSRPWLCPHLAAAPQVLELLVLGQAAKGRAHLQPVRLAKAACGARGRSEGGWGGRACRGACQSGLEWPLLVHLGAAPPILPPSSTARLTCFLVDLLRQLPSGRHDDGDGALALLRRGPSRRGGRRGGPPVRPAPWRGTSCAPPAVHTAATRSMPSSSQAGRAQAVSVTHPQLPLVRPSGTPTAVQRSTRGLPPTHKHAPVHSSRGSMTGPVRCSRWCPAETPALTCCPALERPPPTCSSRWSMTCTTMGSTKAAVLPLPVLAMPCGTGSGAGLAGRAPVHSQQAAKQAGMQCSCRPRGALPAEQGARCLSAAAPQRHPAAIPPPAAAHQHVAPAERGRQRLRLDGRGLPIPSLGHGRRQRGVEAALGKAADGARRVKAADPHTQLASLLSHLLRAEEGSRVQTSVGEH